MLSEIITMINDNCLFVSILRIGYIVPAYIMILLYKQIAQYINKKCIFLFILRKDRFRMHILTLL